MAQVGTAKRGEVFWERGHGRDCSITSSFSGNTRKKHKINTCMMGNAGLSTRPYFHVSCMLKYDQINKPGSSHRNNSPEAGKKRRMSYQKPHF